MHVVKHARSENTPLAPCGGRGNGKPFIIARAGKPVVKVVAVDAPPPGVSRRLGFLAGRISVPSDFDRLGAGDVETLFEGDA